MLKNRYLIGLLILISISISNTSLAQIEDTVLQERIDSIFTNISSFEDINATINNGIVVLTGTTSNAQVKNDARNLVSELNDIVYVIDNIEVEVSVNKSLSPAITKLSNYVENTIATLPLVGIAVIILILFWFIAKFISGRNLLYGRLKTNSLLRNLVQQLVRYLIFILGVVIALDIVGATQFVAAVLGTAGVASLAIGFAFRDIIENYLSGVLISIQQPFGQNDAIRVGDNEGKVVRLTARELVMMTYDGNHIRIPNATIFKSELYNFSRNPLRRFDFLVGVDVEEDLEEVQELGLITLKAMKGILDEPKPYALVKKLGDFNVIVQFFGWVDQKNADFSKVKSQAIRLVKESFDSAGVLMPEPITNIRLKRIPANEALTEEEAQDIKNKRNLETLNEAQNVDVSIDTHLDEQIQADANNSSEENLLNNNSKT